MRTKKTKIKFIILLILVGILLFTAAFAKHLTPYDPYEQELANALAKPSAQHLGYAFPGDFRRTDNSIFRIGTGVDHLCYRHDPWNDWRVFWWKNR